MDKNQNDKSNTNIHIEQVNPRTDINKKEIKEVRKFNIDNEENLSKTQQFKLLNKRKKEEKVELPVLKNSLFDTIKIKLNDLREEIDKKYVELPAEKKDEVEVKKQKKSLYDTVIIKLDDLINKKSALKSSASVKVTKMEKPTAAKKKFHLFKPRDITKMKNIKINVESEEFGRQLYNLNRIALTNLGIERPKNVRKYSTINKLNKIEKVHISKHNYLRYQQKLNRFVR